MPTPLYTNSIITPGNLTVSGRTSDNGGLKNRFINGAMRIDQRNVGAALTIPKNNGATYSVDRLNHYNNLSQPITTQQVVLGASGAPPKIPKMNFVNCVLWTNSTTITNSTNSTGANACFNCAIEANTCTDFGWGNSAPQPITISFWVYVTLPGTYSLSVYNFGGGASYVTTYSVPDTTWNYIKLTIPAPTIGTWATDTSAIFTLYWFIHGFTSNLATSNINSWITTNSAVATTQIDAGAVASTKFALTGIQLEVGTAATAFEWIPWQQELYLCQRYYEKSYDYNVIVGTPANNGTILVIVPGGAGTTNLPLPINYLVEKRIAPTPRLFGVNGATNTLSGYAGSPAVTYTSFSFQSGTKLMSYATFTGLSASFQPGYAYAFGWDVNADFYL